MESIRRVIDAFDRADWSEIDVRVGDVRIHLSAGAPTATPRASGSPSAPSAAPSPTTSYDAAATEPSATLPPGTHVVESPSPGTFWRSPEPGAPPFTDIGQVIDGSATVCIVEVMKLMNHLKAGVGGTVVAVYPDNGVAVSKGDPLFAIAPTTGPVA
jgi:acetyl-CoA carboxylase biotin carboxyl carrier protein